MKIKATPAQCEALLANRNQNDAARKMGNKKIFNQIRQTLGLIGTKKMRIRNITNPDKDTYGVLYDAASGVDLNDGKPDPVAKAPVAASKPTVAPVAKTATKPVAKAAVKPTVKTKEVASTIPGMSPTKTSKHTIEVRTTINGVRKRLGFASSEKAKAAAIAAAKA